MESDQTLKVSQDIGMSGWVVQRDLCPLSTCLHHTPLAPASHSGSGNTILSICTSLKQESHIQASLLNCGYKSQLLLLSQGLTRLLIIKYW